MSIIKKLLGESEDGYDGVVFTDVTVRAAAQNTYEPYSSTRQSPDAGKQVVVLSFSGNPSTYVMGITKEAASKLVQDLQAVIDGSSRPPASSASLAPAGTPPGPST